MSSTLLNEKRKKNPLRTRSRKAKSQADNRAVERFLADYMHYGTNNGGWKVKRREQAFMRIVPYLTRWISTYFNNKGIIKEDMEIFSISWRSFLYCVERWEKVANDPDRGFTCFGHFYRYNQYYLKNFDPLPLLINESRNIVHIDDVYNDISTDHAAEEEVRHCYLDLTEFVECLPDKYKKIMGDIVLGDSITVDERREIGSYRAMRYDTAKAVLKLIYEFFTRKGEYKIG